MIVGGKTTGIEADAIAAYARSSIGVSSFVMATKSPVLASTAVTENFLKISPPLS